MKLSVPVVQHDYKGSEKNLPSLGVVAKRGANFQSDCLANGFLSRFNTLGHEKGSWASLLTVLAEIFGMRIFERFSHALFSKERGSRCPQRRCLLANSLRPNRPRNSSQRLPRLAEVLHQHEVTLKSVNATDEKLSAVWRD